MKILLQGLLAGIGIFIASIAVSVLSQLAMPGITGEYTNPNIFRSWTDPLMSLYYVYPLILGVILSFIWKMTKKLVKDKDYFRRGLRFGFLYWVASSIPGMFITFSSFQVSLALVLTWTVGGLFEAIVAGVILDKVNG